MVEYPLAEKTPKGKPIVYLRPTRNVEVHGYQVVDPKTGKRAGELGRIEYSRRQRGGRKYRGEVFVHLPATPEVSAKIAAKEERQYRKRMKEQAAKDTAKETPTEKKPISYFYNPITKTKTYRVGDEQPKGYLPISQELYKTDKPLMVTETKEQVLLVREKTIPKETPKEEPVIPTTREEFVEHLQTKVKKKGGLKGKKIAVTETDYAIIPESAKYQKGFDKHIGTGIKKPKPFVVGGQFRKIEMGDIKRKLFPLSREIKRGGDVYLGKNTFRKNS